MVDSPSAPHRPVALGTLCLILTACTGGGMPPGVEEGVSLELAEHRSGVVSEVAYDLRLEIPADRAEPVVGSNAVSFEWSDPRGRDLVLDFADPAERVTGVEVNGSPVDWQPRHDHIVVSASDLEPEARNLVSVTFTAGNGALNRSDDFLYTLFVPDRAHTSLPLFDQPDLKARVSLTLSVPGEWEALANGPLVDERSAGNGRRELRYAETQPISSYLIAFAAGRFSAEEAERDGRRMRMLHRETDSVKVADNRDEIFDLVARSIDWMEEYTGVEHPFAKHDFVLIPDFQYGGMEHPGAIFYRQGSLMLDASSTRGDRLGRASLIAHEVAHMWFGDLVTMRWFDDVWTKEVFANFFAAKIVHPSFPEVDHELRFLMAHHPRAYDIDRTPGANPVRQPLENLSEAGTLYGAIIYQKAPIVMRKLEQRVGEATLRDGLRAYLRDHAYGNATWPDLVEELDGRSPGDLTAWSEVWVEEPGRPVVELIWDYGVGGVGRIVVTQEDAWGRERIWPQDLTLVEVRPGADGPYAARLMAQVTLDGPVLDRTPWDGRPRPRWLLPMGSASEYALFVLPDEVLGALMADLPNLPVALDRGVGWLLVEDALWDGRVEPDAVLELALAALEVEDDEQLLDHLLGLTRSIYWRLLSASDRSAFTGRVEARLRAGLADAASVTERASWFSAWQAIAESPQSVDALHRIWAGLDSVPGLPLSEADRTGLALELALRGHPEAEAILDRQADDISNPDRRARFDFIRPAYSADPNARRRFFATLGEAENRAREPWVLAAQRALHHPLRRDASRELIAPSLDLLEEIQRTGDIFFPQRWLDATLGGHNAPDAAREVLAYLERTRGLSPRLRGKLLQSADALFRAARIVHGEAPGLPGPRAR